MMNETLSVILFVIAIPLIQQIVKLYMDKTGNTIGKVGNQAISLGLALVFTILGGGFAGLILPVFPVWAGDLVDFIGQLITYAGAWVALIGAAWGSLTVLYESVYEKLFTKIGLATSDKY